MPKSKPQKSWTKEEIRLLMQYWESKTTEDLSEMLGRPRYSVTAMASRIRAAGHKLPRKRTVGTIESLLKEVLDEM